MKEAPNKNNINNTEQTSRENRVFELRRRAYKLIHSFIETKWKESVNKQEFINKIIIGGIKLIPQATEEMKTEFQALNNLDETKDLESFLNQATEVTIKLMAKYATLEELEEVFQNRQIQEYGNQILSRGLSFEIRKEQARLHIPITFFEDAKSFLDSFTEGLRVLAAKLASDPALQNIKEVTGHSVLVKEKYRLLKKLGFEVVLDDTGKPTEDTKISKEKFLEIYGK